MAALATQIGHFGRMSAQAQTSLGKASQAGVSSDYRALVCIFLNGGNDGNNTVIPNHNDSTISNYNVYSAARNVLGLAIPQANLAGTAITVPRMGNLSYALHPGLGVLPLSGTFVINRGIHDLWGMGKMAIVANTGTLVAPMTRTQFMNNSVKKPFLLFSHPDQITQAQGGRSDLNSFTGWGGRIADLRNTTDNPNGLIPMLTTISGAQLFTKGVTTLPLGLPDSATNPGTALTPAGFANNAAGNARKAAFNALRGVDLSSAVVAAASQVTDAAISASIALRTAQDTTVPFPDTDIGRELRQVARIIKSRTSLNANRQIFFLELGGFDHHSIQVFSQANQLTALSQAMRSFYDEMVAQGISDKVTQFTMSDFGRSLLPDGTNASDVGTDHAWGSHYFVVGGGITASDFYGMNGANGTPYPHLAVNIADDSDSGTGARGRWIPATSVEQYGATLARWFGVPEANLVNVFPKIGNFTDTDLGFMQPPA